MAQAVEGAGEICSIVSDGGEACPAVPGTGGRGVDIRAQGVVSSEIACHPLEVGCGGAALAPQGGDDGVSPFRAVGAALREEGVPCREVDRGVNGIGRGVAGGNGSLAVEQRKLGGP